MCTAITFNPNGHYFGRTLDLEYHYNETVTVTPKGFDFKFSENPKFINRYSIIGMATVSDKYPLYYDAMNEKGLSIAGLNFPGNAVYNDKKEGLDNIAPFEFIPWILSQCKDTNEAKGLLLNVNLVNRNFSDDLPLSPLHWIVADKEKALTVEPMADGLKIYENNVGVLTNNPPFSFHTFNLQNYFNLSSSDPGNSLGLKTEELYSKGLGAFGLPGDCSSASRFIRAAFVKSNSVCENSKLAEINQFFHILGSVEQQRGCVKVKDDYKLTVYTSCCDLDEGVYYYTTYENPTINGVSLFNENATSTRLVSYPLLEQKDINIQNVR